MVITQQRHHVFQAWLDLFVINAALDPITVTVLGPVLQCLLLMNGLPTLIPKTKPKKKSKTKSKPIQTHLPEPQFPTFTQKH